MDYYIHSTLEVTVYPGIPRDQILLECSIDGLGAEAIIVSVNTSKSVAKKKDCHVVRLVL